MEVEFTVKVEDLIAFQRYHIEHRRRRLWLAFIGLSILLFVMIALTEGVHNYEDVGAFVVFPIVFLGGLLVFLFLLARLIAVLSGRWLAWRNPSLLGTERVVLTPQAITSTSEYLSVSTNWAAVQEIGVTQNHVFVFHTSLTAHAIPRRAFSDDESFAAFVETARNCREASKVTRRGP